MNELTPALAAALVAACPRYAYFDQVAVSCGVSYSLLRRWLVAGITTAGEPFRSFAADFFAADAALARRVHELMTNGSLELEVKDLPAGAIPEDLGERIDAHWGPVMSSVLRKARTELTGEGQDACTVTVRLKPPQQKALADWAAKRWPATEHVASILPLLEAKEVKRRTLVDSLRHPTPELAAALAEAGLTTKAVPDEHPVLPSNGKSE